MSDVKISEAVRYVGVNDKTLDLFESQYIVPNGMSYNSYIIVDEQIAVMDSVDARMTEEWLLKVEEVLSDRTPDYLIVQHMEPDHSGSICAFLTKYPQAKLVASAKAFPMLDQFFEDKLPNERIVVSEKETLDLGVHKLQFFMAPMVHWPEVMVTYEASEKLLFTADAFGTFGTLDAQEEDWACEARRYYFNIVGKYGPSVQALLKKVSALDVARICPLHGPVLSEDLAYYVGKYDTWSSYRPEDRGVLIAYGSIHGNTKRAAEELAGLLKDAGEERVSLFDLSRDDMAEAIEDAFRYDRMVLAGPTYDANLFPCVEDFLYHLQMKNYQNRTVGLIENGSWAPMAAKKMQSMLEGCKNLTLLEPVVTIRSALNARSRETLGQLAKALLEV